MENLSEWYATYMSVEQKHSFTLHGVANRILDSLYVVWLTGT